jgi:hypothetical protein
LTSSNFTIRLPLSSTNFLEWGVETMASEQAGGATRATRARQLNIRVDEDTYDRIIAVVSTEGRTQNGAIAELIRRGYEADLRFGDVFGSVAGFALARALVTAAEAATAGRGADRGRWLQDQEAYETAAAAMTQLLHLLKPGVLRQAAARIEDAQQRLQAQGVVADIEHAHRTAGARDKRAGGRN